MSDATRTGLLVSVSARRMRYAAAAGGADLIDIKEPTKGPLGMAEAEVVAGIVERVNGKVPVSAAARRMVVSNAITEALFGTWRLKLDYVKWG